MRIIALANQKGGVGKTTSAINIAAGLCKLGKPTLLIDLDPQAHATYSLGLEPGEQAKTVYNLLKGEAAIGETIAERGGLKIVPADLDLAGVEREISETPGREFLLREALRGLRGFDFVLIDCPPSLGLLTVNALAAAQEVFVPIQAEFLALRGVAKLRETVDAVRTKLNRRLELVVFATRFDGRKVLNREVVEKLTGYFGASKPAERGQTASELFSAVIRENIALAEAPAAGKTIYEYAPGSHGAEDYLELCKEILKRGGKA